MILHAISRIFLNRQKPTTCQEKDAAQGTHFRTDGAPDSDTDVDIGIVEVNSGAEDGAGADKPQLLSAIWEQVLTHTRTFS